MYLIVLYFLHSASVLSFYIDVVLTLSIIIIFIIIQVTPIGHSYYMAYDIAAHGLVTQKSRHQSACRLA